MLQLGTALLAILTLAMPLTARAQEMETPEMETPEMEPKASATADVTPEQKYDQAVSLFEDGEYKQAQLILAEILFPAPIIEGKEKVQKAQALLAAAYLAMGDMKSANRVVNVIIESDVSFKFGPEYDPSLIAMAEKYRTKKEKEIAAKAPPPEPESTPFNPLRLLPLGIGQYSDGRYVAGTIYLLIQAGLAAGSFYFYDELTSAHKDTNANLNAGESIPCQLGPLSDCQSKKVLTNTLGAAFYGAMVLSVIEAIVFAPDDKGTKSATAIEPKMGFDFGPTRDGGAHAGFSLQF